MLQQLAEIRDYYLAQMHKVREHFDQQRKLITEFSVNRMSSEPPSDQRPPNDVIVRVENGAASTMATAAADEDDLYRYNESMKSEIRRLTSLRNLHEAFAVAAESETKFGVAPAAAGSCNGGSAGSCANKETPAAATGAASSAARYDLYADNASNGGKLLRTSEDEGDEKTSMLHNAKICRWKCGEWRTRKG